MDKSELRKEILRIRDGLSKQELETRSNHIMHQVVCSEAVTTASEIFTYVSFGSEVDTFGLIRESLESNKKVLVPRVLKNGVMEFYPITSINDLKPGKYGILEPDGDISQPFTGCGQVMIVPGVAFDPGKNRMGYGGGFYDRYFERYAQCQNHTIGVCYELQIMKQVPVESFDRKVNMLITENNVY